MRQTERDRIGIGEQRQLIKRSVKGSSGRAGEIWRNPG